MTGDGRSLPTYEFTVTLRRRISFRDLSAWGATTHDEAAANEAKLLTGADGQGDYLDFWLGEGDHTTEIEYRKVSE